MPGLTVYLDDADHAALKQAAREAHLSLREFCRRASIDAARQLAGGTGRSLADMVREIHAAIVPTTQGGEVAAATAALVQLGLDKATAAKRARLAPPGSSADQIITLALKQEG